MLIMKEVAAMALTLKTQESPGNSLKVKPDENGKLISTP
jgi:hypothetical protein